MSEEIKKLIEKNLKSLFEDYGFENMESAFGVGQETDTDQFGGMDLAKDEIKANYDQKDPDIQSELNKVHKDASKEATEYYKEVVDKMGDYQKPNQESEPSEIGEAFEPKKRNAEEFEEDMGHSSPSGSGMEGLRYDDEESENYKAFEERMDDLNGGDDEDSTYGKLKKAGKKYKKYKYGEEKYDEAEDEYQETPKVRVTTKESVSMKYSDVEKENIFKTKGKIVSEEQVVKVSKKVPSRVKIDETVFAITDGENYYRLIWEGTEEDGEAIITHHKNKEVVSESVEKMKHLWNFNSNDAHSTKKTVTENTDDIFKKMMNKMRSMDGLINESVKEEGGVCEACGSEYMGEGEMCEACGSDHMEEAKIKNPGKYMGGERQKLGIDDDGDGVPDGADKKPKDGDVD